MALSIANFIIFYRPYPRTNNSALEQTANNFNEIKPRHELPEHQDWWPEIFKPR